MDKELSALEAFLALRDLDGEDVSGMLKNKKLKEGKEFSLFGKDLDEAQEELNKPSDETELEVIDVNADSVEHLKAKKEYVGQMLLQCNKCKSIRFIDADKLVPSEDNPDVYNVEDECPHCHASGAGYELHGQVGKVESEKPVEEEPLESEGEPEEVKGEPEEVKGEELPELSNDEGNEGEATFDNDVEPEEEPSELPSLDAESENNNQPESNEQEEISVDDKIDELEDKDGMETTSNEDEDIDLELPSLGDEVAEKIPDEDIEDNKQEESLQEEFKFENDLAKEAWMMNKVIEAMNNEEAYYGSWLYIWPDEETKEQCEYDFGDEESFNELRDAFISNYKYYHEDGLYNVDDDVLNYAHSWDDALGLRPIDNYKPEVKEELNEEFDHESVDLLFDVIVDADNMDSTIVVYNVANGDSEIVYQGNYDDMPEDIKAAPLVNFDAADGYFTVNIDSDSEVGTSLEDALEVFGDDFTDKIIIWDQATGQDMMQGTKEDVIESFGNRAFLSFEAPERLEITINAPEVVAESIDAIPGNGLFEKVCEANNLSAYRKNNPASNEYWINESIELKEDLDVIYRNYILPTSDKKLIEQFKSETGYRDIVDEAKAKLGVSEDYYFYGDKKEEEKPEEESKCKECEKEEPKKEEVKECNESIKSFKTRKQLAEAIQACKNNNRPYSIRRSLTEGFRYDLVTESKLDPMDPDEMNYDDSFDDTTYDEYFQNAKNFAFKEIPEMTIDQAEDLFYNEYAFDSKKPQDAAEEMIYKALLNVLEGGKVVDEAKKKPYHTRLVNTNPEANIKAFNHAMGNDAHVSAGDVGGVMAGGGDGGEGCCESLTEAKKDEEIDKITDSMEKVETIIGLIDDEVEAVDGYTDAIETIDDSKIPNKEEIISKLHHIKGEELEHIDELREVEALMPSVGELADEPEKTLEPIEEEPVEELPVPEEVPEELPEEPVGESLVKESLYDKLLAYRNGKLKEKQVEENLDEVEFDTEKFDRDVNQYFDEAYDETYLYHTTSGSVLSNGNIILEGYVKVDNIEEKVLFTLKPTNRLNESLTEESLAKATYDVTNTLSEEVFEYKQ